MRLKLLKFAGFEMGNTPLALHNPISCIPFILLFTNTYECSLFSNFEKSVVLLAI